MAYQFPPEIEQLIKQQMESGEYESEDQLLADALRALALRNADVVAVNEAIHDMETGDAGRPLAEVADEIRRKYGGRRINDLTGSCAQTGRAGASSSCRVDRGAPRRVLDCPADEAEGFGIKEFTDVVVTG